jgi:hypothetical protein
MRQRYKVFRNTAQLRRKKVLEKATEQVLRGDKGEDNGIKNGFFEIFC